MRKIFTVEESSAYDGYVVGKRKLQSRDFKTGELYVTHRLMFSEEYFTPVTVYECGLDSFARAGEWVLTYDTATNLLLSIEQLQHDVDLAAYVQGSGSKRAYKISSTNSQKLIDAGIAKIPLGSLEHICKDRSDKFEITQQSRRANEDILEVDSRYDTNVKAKCSDDSVSLGWILSKFPETLVVGENKINMHQIVKDAYLAGFSDASKKMFTRNDLTKAIDDFAKELISKLEHRELFQLTVATIQETKSSAISKLAK